MSLLSFVCLSLLPGFTDSAAAAGAGATTSRSEPIIAGRVLEHADDLVRRALEYEAGGDAGQRTKYLERAVEAQDDEPRARGLLGMMRVNDRWVGISEAIELANADPENLALLSEYERRRSAAPDSVAAQWKLALWCQRNGLQPEAVAHLTSVTRLDPGHRAAWELLGCRLYKGRWLNSEQIAAEKLEIVEQSHADQFWRPRLVQWRGWLADPAKQADAVAALGEVRDPRAIPSVARIFGGSATRELWAVRILGKIDSPVAAQRLADLAVFGLSPAIRESAVHRLQKADPRAFVGLLIDWIKEPTHYEVVPPSGRQDTTEVRIEDSRSIVERRYQAPPKMEIPERQRGDTLTTDSQGRDVLLRVAERSRLLSNGHYGSFREETRIPVGEMAEEAVRATKAVVEQMKDDLRAIDQANLKIAETNERVLHTLYLVTESRIGADQKTWTSWWSEELGYRYDLPKSGPKQFVVQEVAAPYVPPPAASFVTVRRSSLHSCFGAGTLVTCRSGTRPIENLKVGDLVLTQDTTTGALSFQPVLTVFHNPPSRVLCVELEHGESLIATDIHRFWIAGKGWTMTRDLKRGDRLRILGGTSLVTSIESEPNQPVYNLEVAKNHSFFVGRCGSLVHDNTLVLPVHVVFDAPSGLAGQREVFVQ
jgi:hypothetical protein